MKQTDENNRCQFFNVWKPTGAKLKIALLSIIH